MGNAESQPETKEEDTPPPPPPAAAPEAPTPPLEPVALTTPPHAAQSRRARTARVRHVLRRGAAAYGDAYQALLGARMQERTFLSRP